MTGRRGRKCSPSVRTFAFEVQLAVGACMLLVAATGCDLEPDLSIGRSTYGVVVEDHVSSSCSTATVRGLSEQIAEEIACMDSEALVRLDEGSGVVFSGSAVLPYLSRAGRDDLLAALAAHGGEIRINSGFRTVAQQYLLYRWYQQGRCGIPVAATPGRSNHESGRALDIGNYGVWGSRLPGFGWAQTVPGDPVHFDHLDSPDNRGLDVMAFQRLWNRNHPGDSIAEDGIYGPQTAARLAQAPPDGFPKPACSPGDNLVAGGVRVSAPETLAPGERSEVTIWIENQGLAKWPKSSTRLITAGPMGRASAFYDDSWTSAEQPAVAVAGVEPGATLELRFTIRAPYEPGGYVESFALEVDGETMQPMGLDVDVIVDADVADESFGGGCATSGPSGAAGFSLLVLGLVAGRIRRRRTDSRCRRRRARR